MIADKIKKNILRKDAQTAIELAVFGAVLVFVIGAMVRHAMNFNNIQNQTLSAMRLALKQSFLSGEGGSSSRNYASILFIEDRKDVEVSRYGARARTPFILSGSGAFSKHMFMTMDYNVLSDLPIMDMFINGKHLTFTTAGYGSCELFLDQAGADAATLGNPCNQLYLQEVSNDCLTDDAGQPVPCAVLYAKIIWSDERFCAPDRGMCDATTEDTMDDRFDLDRDPLTSSVDMDLRNDFSWQWYPVKMTIDDVDPQGGINISLDIDGDLKEEQVLGFEDYLEIEHALHENPTMNWQQMEEYRKRLARNLRIIKVFFMDSQRGDIDFTYNTYDKYNLGKLRPGLQDEMLLYTFIRTGPDSGTYAMIEEGKLYNMIAGEEDRQYIRNVQKQDKVDIIERRIRLSNDTGRMCKGPHASGCDKPGVDGIYDPVNGPVEAWCGDKDGTCPKAPDCCSDGTCPDNSVCNLPLSCCYGGNMFKTCFDRNCKMLYVRSRIEDKTGRKWITDVSLDEMSVE